MNEQQTPLTEAVSLISIVSVLIAICCYVGAVENVPLVSPCLFWVAKGVYSLFPALSYLTAPQIPIVASAIAVGGAFFLFTIPFAGQLAKVFSIGQLSSIERQTARLKRNRSRITQLRRDRDNFDVS